MSAEKAAPWARRVAVVSLPVLVALGLAACGKGGAAAGGAPGITEVGVVTLQAQALALATELPGRTVAVQSAEIRPQVGGLIKQRLFTEGSTVKAGQPLYQIDPASYQATLDSARATLAKAQAVLATAKLTAKRQADLLAADAGSRADAEDARSALLQAEADVQSAKASEATAALNLSYTRITAPISGRIETSTVTAGALVTASQTTALTTVQQLDPMYVDIPQSSVDVLKLRQQLASGVLKNGQARIKLVLEDGSNYKHEGQLQVSGVTVNTTTGAVTLRASVPNPEGLLLPGMYVRAVLAQAEDPNALLVPQAGVARNARGEASALVVGEGDKVVKRAVTVAQSVNGQWRVTQGLKSGDRLIVEGVAKVREGQEVKPVPAGSAAPAATAAPAASAASAASR